MNVYAMFDKKSTEYFGICTWKNDDLYKRSVASVAIVDDPQNYLNRYPTDFELWQLGTIDLRTGIISPSLEFVCSVADLLKGAVKDE